MAVPCADAARCGGGGVPEAYDVITAAAHDALAAWAESQVQDRTGVTWKRIRAARDRTNLEHRERLAANAEDDFRGKALFADHCLNVRRHLARSRGRGRGNDGISIRSSGSGRRSRSGCSVVDVKCKGLHVRVLLQAVDEL